MVNSLIHFFIDPFNILWLLALAACILYVRKQRKQFLFTAGLTLIWFLIISTPFVPVYLLNSLESQYRPVLRNSNVSLQEPVEIVVLGGGHINDRSLPPSSRLYNRSLSRIIEAIRLHHVYPESNLILSGNDSGGITTQADMFALTARDLGINSEYLIKHGEPLDTWMEIRAYLDRYDTLPDNGETQPGTLIIVTSASHMPRAVKMARYLLPESVDIIASPSDFKIRVDKDMSFDDIEYYPSVENIEYMTIALKEYAGIVEFHLLLK
jgi:uncharacterized SAM-binding protein YcdF (DUF218 family)